MNYYALEPLIVERLQTACPSVGDITGLPHVFALKEATQNCKASTNPHHPDSNPNGEKHGGVYVIFWSEDVKQSRADGCCQTDQTWLVAVAAKQLQDLRTGSAVRRRSGALAQQVLAALAGWNYAPGLGYAGKQTLERITVPVNRHQLVPDDNGIDITYFAYKAKNLTF